jgi:tyrosine-protein kinase Etk/Wzc
LELLTDHKTQIEEKRTLSPPDGPELEEISLLALFGLLGRNKRKILRVVLITAAVAIPSVFLIPATYTAEAVIFTPQQAQPSLSSMAQLSGVGAAGLPALSLLSGLGMRSPADLYIGVLKSRSVADDLIQQFNLRQVYDDKYLMHARKHLARNTTIATAKDTLIHVEVEDRDPKRAAGLANAYIDELSKQSSRLALTDASQRRTFYEQELRKEKDALADAEVALRNTQQVTGLVIPGQAEALIRSGAQLRVEIMAREAQLEAMKTFATDDNPRLQIVKRELSVLQGELKKVEEGGQKTGVLDLPTQQLPEAGLKYVRKLRDVKYHEALFEILSKQYEAARLDEGKSAPLIQIVDRAVIPERRSWPPRTIIILAAVLLATLVCCFQIARTATSAPHR